MTAGYAMLVILLVVAAHVRHDASPAGAVLAAALVVAGAVVALPLAVPIEPASDPDRGYLTRPVLALITAGALALTWAHVTATSYRLLAGAALGLPVVLVVLRAWQATRGAAYLDFAAHPMRTGQRRYLAQAGNYGLYWVLLAATALTGTYDGLASWLPGGATTLRVSIVVGSVVGLLTALVPARQVLAATNVFVAACSLFVAAELVATYRAPAGPVTLAAPCAGDWYVQQGGRSELVDRNRAVPGQHDAVDLVEVAGTGGAGSGGGQPAGQATFDAPVLAPAAGVVVYQNDDLPDRPAAVTGGARAAGNVLVINLGGGRYLRLSHLEQGSALVGVGDRVARGQALARVGSSGDVTGPVLQIQVQDTGRPDNSGGHTYPILLRGVRLTRDGQTTAPAVADLRRGDRLHADTW
jgi:hypothetical protein